MYSAIAFSMALMSVRSRTHFNSIQVASGSVRLGHSQPCVPGHPDRRQHSRDNGLVVASADLGHSLDDWLNLRFVKIVRHKRFYVCERTKKNRYCRTVL